MADEHAGDQAERPLRPMAAPVLRFDFTEEAERLRGEKPWLHHGRNAVTLVKYGDFRVVLLLLKAGTKMQEHQVIGRISLQTLSGHVRMQLEEQTIDLPAGHLLALERELVHDVEACEDSAVLLTIAWPGEVMGG